jgi:hypothetical protein
VVFQVLKVIICCRQHTVVGSSVGTANPYYVRLLQMVLLLFGICNVSNANFFSLWIGNNDVWVMQQRVEMEQIQLHLLQVWRVLV